MEEKGNTYVILVGKKINKGGTWKIWEQIGG